MPTFQAPIGTPSDSDPFEVYRRVLEPEDPSTGGGSASAIAGAMAAALIAMVAHLSMNNSSKETEANLRMIFGEAQKLKGDLIGGGLEDSKAFTAVQAAYRMPKTTEEEKAERMEEIQRAMLMATHVPLANAERCLQLLNLAQQLYPIAKPATASDIHCAKLLAQAGFHGCIANVEINLPHIRDAANSGELAKRAKELEIIVKTYEKDPTM
jgi:methenyltetrahydrofolate cyclohydrolase